MKKIVILFLFLSLFSFSQLFCYSSVNYSTANELNVGIDIPEVVLSEKEYRDSNTYSSIILPNTGQLTVGKPDVPGLSNWILIPNGTNVSITTYPGAPNIIKNVDLAPVQLEPFDNVDSPLPPFEKDKSTYSRNSDYPGTFAEVESTKRKRGQECTILWIYPYQYNPVERTLTVYPDLQVSVNFNGIIKPIPANLVNDRLIESLKSFAINAEEVLQAELSSPQTKTDRLERTDGCELLIISDPSYMTAANTLGDWKTKRGIYTTVVSTSTTGTSVSAIENYIDNAYDTWTPAPSYFLFIGDDEDIPAQDVTTTPSDFYYADRDDPPDWVADFGYGRLSVDTAAQADSLVARIIRYERSPTTNSDFYEDILNAACFQDGEYWGTPTQYEEPDGIANRRFCKTSEDVRNFLHDQQGFPWSQREYIAYNRVPGVYPGEIFPEFWNDITQIGNFIFENDNPPSGGVEIPDYMQKPTYNGFDWNGSTADISSAFNNGVFFALFRAHGSTSGWGDPDFNSGNVDALTNGENRPIIWSITCQSGRFDGLEGFAEHWIRHSTGGSCGVLAAVRNSSSGKNDRLIWGMMNAIWPNYDSYCSFSYGGSTPIYRLGDVKNYGMEYMATHYIGEEQTMRLFHWFGDPTMEMWTSQPSNLTTAYTTTTVDIGTSSMTVRVEPAVSGMLVCAYTDNADEIFATATTNASGYAYLTFNNPLTVEPIVDVTITKHNYRPYEFKAGINTWEGTISNSWYNDNNWSYGYAPTSIDDTVIPSGTPYSPIITAGTAYCNDLTIESGATLTQNGTSYFYVYGSLDSDLGTFTQSGVSYLYFDGSSSTHWDDDNEDDTYTYVRVNKDTDTATLMMWQDMTVNNNFEVREGVFEIDFTWTLTVNGATTNDFEVEDGGTLNLTDESLDIAGGINFNNGSRVNIIGGSINCGRNFNILANTSYDIIFGGGVLTFDGTGDQYLSNEDGGSSAVYDLTIDKPSGYCFLLSDFNINGDLLIEDGTLSCGNGPLPSEYFDIGIAGNWTNNVGTSGFYENSGRVVFNSSSHQFCYGETFNILEMAKPMMDFIIPTGTTTTCQQLDWTNYNGEIEALGGTFIAYDLEESGIFGKYYIPSGGGIIELHNDGLVDLNGRIVMAAGTMNVHGSGNSWWSDGGDATITMSGGILDFNDSGIRIYDGAYSFTENITAGTIRTSGYFIIERTNYTPTGGEIELYGDVDADINMAAGSNMYNVRINKAATDVIASKLTDPEYNKIDNASPNKRRTTSTKTDSRKIVNTQPAKIEFDREGNAIELTRSSTVNATSELDINGNLYIDNGTLDLTGFNVDVRYILYNYGNLIVDSILNIGDDCYYYSGSNVDLSGTMYNGSYAGRHGSSNHYSGSTFNQSGYYYVEQIKLYNGCQYNGTSGTLHIYVDGHVLNNNIEIDDPDSYFYRLDIDTGAYGNLYDCSYDLESNSVYLYAPLDINVFTLNTNYMDVYGDGELIIDNSGVVNVNSNGPYFHSDGTLTMTTGSILDSELNIQFQTGSIENVSGGDIYMEGSFTNNNEIFSPTGGVFTFDGTSASIVQGTTYFHDLTIDKAISVATVTTNSTIYINDLLISSGIFDTGGNNIEVNGDWTNNVGNTGFVEGTQTVSFGGAGYSQITTDETFYNMREIKTSTSYNGLQLNDGLTVTVLNNLDLIDGRFELENNTTLNIGNDLYIAYESGLNAWGETGIEINIGGDWSNYNTSWNTAYGYSPGTEIVTFNGNTDQFLYTDAPQEDFGNLVIDKSGGEFRSNDNIRVMHDLDIITGNWHDNASTLTHYFEGDVYVTAGTSAGFNSLTNNIVVFKGTADQTLYNPNGYHYFGDVIVDKTTWPTRSFEINESTEIQRERINNVNMNDETRALTVTLTSNIDMQMGNGLTVEEGTLDLNGHNLYTMGDVLIYDGGKIIVDEGAELQVYGGDDLNVYNGGIIEVLGSSGNLATVTHRSTGNYDFNIYGNVNGGALISAEYGLFEYMMWNGVYVYEGAFVDPVHSFNYCTFQNGYVGSGPLLYINNDEEITITGAHFPDDASSDYNIAKVEAHGLITMVNATGIFAGEGHDYDLIPDRTIWTTGLTPIDDLTIQYNEGANTIVLTWTYPVPVDQFRVYRSTDPYDFSSATVFTTSTVGYSEPATGTKYFYRVTAENITDNVGTTSKNNYSEAAPWGK